jgi:hypothetical protein
MYEIHVVEIPYGISPIVGTVLPVEIYDYLVAGTGQSYAGSSGIEIDCTRATSSYRGSSDIVYGLDDMLSSGYLITYFSKTVHRKDYRH